MSIKCVLERWNRPPNAFRKEGPPRIAEDKRLGIGLIGQQNVWVNRFFLGVRQHTPRLRERRLGRGVPGYTVFSASLKALFIRILRYRTKEEEEEEE